MEDLYTKVFIQTDLNKEELFALLLTTTKGKKQLLRTITLPLCEIDLSVNKDYAYKIKNNQSFDENNFLFFPFFIEIAPIDESTSKQKFISFLDEFLEILSSYNIKLVTTCDFEDELKQKGNYNIN